MGDVLAESRPWARWTNPPSIFIRTASGDKKEIPALIIKSLLTGDNTQFSVEIHVCPCTINEWESRPNEINGLGYIIDSEMHQGTY
jgi:hypothetical protein